MTKKDYYITLGIVQTESEEEIRDAFRELVKSHHPDVSGPDATPRFKEIIEAYEVLSDPKRRRAYNETRSAEPSETRSMGPEALVPEPISIMRDFGRYRPSRDAMFERFMRNWGGAPASRGEQLEGLNLEIILSPEEAERGAVAPIGVPVFRTCPQCSGTGKDWMFPCAQCGAHGLIEGERTVRIKIPPMVKNRTVLEVPLSGLGVHNFYLRLHILIDRRGAW